MSSSVRWSVALSLALAVFGCSPPPPPPPDITVTATPDTLPGDGMSESRIEVSRPGTVDVTLRVGRGSFKETGRTSIVIEGGTGTATYVACDSLVVAGCAGTLRIGADSEDEAVGSATITIGQREICSDGVDNDKNGQSDCADSVCLGKTCASNDAGVRICDASGACVCSTGTTEDCTNGTDDNCDGKIDCADPTCDQKGCFVTAGVGGRCSNNTCSCTAGAELCADGMDNDCDGKIDCGDTDCRATAAALGKVCDTATGLTCSQADSMGVSTCTVCPGGSGPEAAALCSDNLDNDCDGQRDCFDTDCANRDCRSAFSDAGVGNGWKCDLASAANDKCACTGNGGTAEVSETTCNDGFDNDCDGRGDCADPDCLAGGGQVCGTFGKRCLAINNCGCGATTENCRTPQDDDCDGMTNCEEISCRPGTTGLGAVCDESGNTCSQVLNNTSTCTTCSGNGGPAESAEGATGGTAITCGDGKDNDCDGTVATPSTDCQDSDCAGRSCNATGGICNGATKRCGCPSGVTNERDLCSDGIDNDCDGQTDCFDADCRPFGTTGGSVCGANGRTCTATAGQCACSGNGGLAQTSETTCNDGADNDCDGLADCADSACQPVGNNPGKLCDSRGNTCSNVLDGGASVCNVCSGNDGGVQVAEFSCGDNADNDCDGLIDCQDPGCDALACSSTGKRCNGAGLVCVCTGPEAAAEVTCGDGQDNDCDGLIDCLDPNCQPVSGQQARSCSTTGRFCTATGTCACSGNGGAVETAEGSSTTSATCGDGFDNDCDGLVDCADQNCKATTLTGFGKDCSAGTVFGAQCDFGGVCVCPGGQATEATCDDGLDNDCDGLRDCADPNCGNQLCVTTSGQRNGRRCSGSPSTCACPTGLANETAQCSNGTDDDCDGLADCADPDCQGSPGQLCLAGNSTYRCLLRGSTYVCADGNETNNITVISRPIVTPASVTPNVIPADGVSQTTISATLRNSTGGLVPGQTINFAVTGGGTVSPLTAITDAQGVATTVYTAPTTSGNATVTATLNGTTVSGAVVLTLPRLGQVKLTSVQYAVMGVKSSSFREDNLVTFQLLDADNKPYPPGLQVNFTHAPSGGSFIGSAPDCTGTPVVCRATDTTDNTGFVTVNLRSGTAASIVSVTASAAAGGSGSLESMASNIAIVGAKAHGLRMSLDCTPNNIPAFTDNNCTNSFFPALVRCTVSLADRFNNVLGVSTLVTFSSEAGAAGQPTATPDYAPGNANLGKTTGTVTVAGFSLPVDVPPFTNLGEYSLTRATACGQREVNPRDGLVTVIASAIGEEGFVDGNSNGVYDPGETFFDQGEPFVDANDNGTRETTEPFIDTNANNTYQGPNGVWDANTVIWAEDRVLYTGYTAVYTTARGDEQSRWWNAGTPPAPTTPPYLVLAPNTSTAVGVRFMDENFNYPTLGTTYALNVVRPTTGVTATFTTTPSNFDILGMTVSQQFCNASATPACGNVCVGTAGTPWCLRTVTVGDYGYGNGGVVSVSSSRQFITDGGVATNCLVDPFGPGCFEVRANATFQGVTQPFSLYGVAQ